MPSTAVPREKVSFWRRLAQLASIAFFVLLVVFVTLGLVLPANLDVSVTRDLKLAPNQIYSRLSDLRQWPTWLPWMAEDPGMAIQYQGMTTGVGMVMSWDSQRHGEGRITIAAVEPDERVQTSVEFKRQGTCVASFVLEPQTKTVTTVRLRFLSEYGQNYAGRYMGWLAQGYTKKKLEECLENLESSTLAGLQREEDRKLKAQALPETAPEPVK